MSYLFILEFIKDFIKRVIFKEETPRLPATGDLISRSEMRRWIRSDFRSSRRKLHLVDSRRREEMLGDSSRQIKETSMISRSRSLISTQFLRALSRILTPRVALYERISSVNTFVLNCASIFLSNGCNW